MISYIFASALLIFGSSLAQGLGNESSPFSEQSSPIAFTKVPSNLVVGEPYEIKWDGRNSDSVTISLKEGSPDNLQTVLVIARSISGNAYTWTPPESVVPGSDYALELSSDSDPSNINYSGLFSITNPLSSTSSPAAASKISSTATAPASETSEPSSERSTASRASISTPTSIITSSLPSVQTLNASPTPQRSASNQVSTTKLGIGLGVPLGVLIIAILAFIVFWIRRHRAGRAPRLASLKRKGPSLWYGSAPEIDGTSKDPQVRAEMDGQSVPSRSQELQGSPGVRRHELSSENWPKP